VEGVSAPAGQVRVDGKVAVVIGGGGGLGGAIAAGLAGAGATVVVAGRDRDRAEAAAAAIRDGGGRAAGQTADTVVEADLEALRERVLADHGRLDILVNAAGSHLRRPTVDTDLEQWRRVLEVNLTGPFLACKVIGAAMLARGDGRIVNVASMAAHVGLDETAAYGASKGGLVALTRSLAREWAGRGVTVNSISPGFFLTDMNARLIAEGTERRRRIDERTPAGRVGRPEELVGAVVFLVSDAAGYVTGVDLPVDGGFLIGGI
jgi:NAD(P)-dependent dehydrogenase (short-subunit alcohol dehydrogenase family)